MAEEQQDLVSEREKAEYEKSVIQSGKEIPKVEVTIEPMPEEIVEKQMEETHSPGEPVKFRRCMERKKQKLADALAAKQAMWALYRAEEEEEDEEGEEEEVDLEDIEVSDSSIGYSSLFSIIPFEWENQRYEFLDLCDPGTMDNIYHKEEAVIEYDIYGRKKYLTLCNEMRIPPIVRFYNSLKKDEVDLTFHGVDKNQMRAMSSALEMNVFVENLILKGNALSTGSCFFLAKLLRKNNAITQLDMTGCKIGPEGAALLAQGLRENEGLKEVNLTRCYVEDEGMRYLSKILRENYILEKLILCHNKLSGEAAESLGAMFPFNTRLKTLILDYNYLSNPTSMKKFFRGLGFNSTMRNISLRWNSISASEIVEAVSLVLRRNRSLLTMDLSDNRIDSDALKPLKKGLSASLSLETLRLARNPLSSQDADYLLGGVKASPSIKLLDLEDLWVGKDFLKNYKKLQLVKEVEIRVGGVYSGYTLIGPDYQAILLKRAQYEAMRPKSRAAKRDFGHLMFMLGDEPLSMDGFQTTVSKFKAKVSEELLAELTKEFTIPRSSNIDVVSMRKKYLSLFPDARPPEVKKTKKGEDDEDRKVMGEAKAEDGVVQESTSETPQREERDKEQEAS